MASESEAVLPTELLVLIGEYGAACDRSRSHSDVERLHRWELLIAGIKEYTRSSTPSAETLDRRELQREGKHPAPCARHCESTAYEIEIRRLKAALAGRAPSAEAKDAGYRRYEYIRTLAPRAYAELWRRNICGEGPFDALVDAAIAQQPKEDDRGPSR